jgi:hypothetical protein
MVVSSLWDLLQLACFDHASGGAVGARVFRPDRADPTGNTGPMTATIEQLDQAIDHVASAPGDVGSLELLVCRPAVGEREVLVSGELIPARGLVGDNYVERGSTKTPAGRADPLDELNVMSARSIEAVAGVERTRWPLAGDQLIVDFDLSEANCPPGTRLRIGTAVIEVTAKPHTGCSKFAERFGIDAARWVNSRKDLRLRGICAVVVTRGSVAPGDTISKV